jgi:hypothetical protein
MVDAHKPVLRSGKRDSVVREPVSDFRKAAKKLAAIMGNHFRDDPEILDVWRHVRHIERAEVHRALGSHLRASIVPSPRPISDCRNLGRRNLSTPATCVLTTPTPFASLSFGAAIHPTLDNPGYSAGRGILCGRAHYPQSGLRHSIDCEVQGCRW